MADAVFAKTFEIPRSDGTNIRFYLETPLQTAFPIVVIIQGSTCDSSWNLFQQTKGYFVSYGIGVVSVEKYGLNESTKDCPQSYLQNNTIQQRISDHLMFVNFLRNNLKGWNGKIVWVGGSEGGQVGSLVAPLVSETAAVAMLASGGGMTMAEELPLVFAKMLKRKGSNSSQIAKQIKDINNSYREIKLNPTWKIEWLSDGKKARNTYKYWNSILWIKALSELEKLQIPIYIAHGTEDTSSAYESSKLIADRFILLGKQNLTFKTYIGLEHNFSDLNGVSHQQEVLTSTINWIINILKTHSFSKEQLKLRDIQSKNKTEVKYLELS
jgi:dienelactone hydrolase